jgi:dienelactone hydrolase
MEVRQMTQIRKLGLPVILILAVVFPVTAQNTENIRTMEIPYTVDGKDFIGFLAYDSTLSGNRPGVLVVHEWRGINEYARKRATDLASEGYVAFALDMYGDGMEVPMSEARSMSSAVGSDFPLIKDRFNTALDILMNQDMVDSSRIAAIGYCFGGGIVLNMARMGTDINGVVSFHGSINTGLNAGEGDIQTKILAFQGDEDPAAPREKQAQFREELDASEADYTYVVYDNVPAHNFTNSEGNSYYEKEANMAWDNMLEFFDIIF